MAKDIPAIRTGEPMRTGSTTFTGRRTRLRAGSEADYRRVHSRIPDAVAAALRESGVVSWQIWQDGRSLLHAIETRQGYAAMLAKIESLGPIDREWDVLIASLLESSPSDDVLLPLVWGMDVEAQWSNPPQEAPGQA